MSDETHHFSDAEDPSDADHLHNALDIVQNMSFSPDRINITGLKNVFEYTGIQWRDYLEEKCLPLTEEQDEHLRLSHVRMVQSIDIDDVLDYLVQDGIVSYEQEQIIRSRSSPEDSVREMKKIVKCQGQQGIYSLARAIYLTSPHYRSKSVKY